MTTTHRNRPLRGFATLMMILASLASVAGCALPGDASEGDKASSEFIDWAEGNPIGSEYCRAPSATRTQAGEEFDCLDVVGPDQIKSEHLFDIKDKLLRYSSDHGYAFEAVPHGPWRVECEADECEGQAPVNEVSRQLGLSLRDGQGNLVEAGGEVIFKGITVMSPSDREDRSSQVLLTPFWEGHGYLDKPIEVKVDVLDGMQLVVEPVGELPPDFEARIWYVLGVESCHWDWVAGYCRPQR